MRPTEEIIARTILRESYEKPEYLPVAWVIFNRVVSGRFPGKHDPKEVCLAPNQFHVWKAVWGKDVPENPASLAHRDYPICLGFANKMVARIPPSDRDPTGGALYFNKDHGSGVKIGEHWYYK